MRARIVRIDDPEYPAGLRDLDDAPPHLTVRGWLPQNGIAIVGSREPSSEAAAFARELAARIGEPVVAGLARGIDTAAHQGALDAGIATIAYVGTGIDVVSLPENAPLAERIAECGGAIATELAAGTEATAASLERRDRLQAAHARAVVLITSEPAGGAMHTLRFAASLGRPCYVLDPSDPSVQAGNAIAARAGATILEKDVEDALRMLEAR